METMIVEISIAANQEHPEFVLPAHVPIEELLPAILHQVEQTYQDLQYDPAQTLLCDLRSRRILPASLTLAQAGVRQGHRLLLI